VKIFLANVANVAIIHVQPYILDYRARASPEVSGLFLWEGAFSPAHAFPPIIAGKVNRRGASIAGSAGHVFRLEVTTPLTRILSEIRTTHIGRLP
jgi:hypothetical protein